MNLTNDPTARPVTVGARAEKSTGVPGREKTPEWRARRRTANAHHIEARSSRHTDAAPKTSTPSVVGAPHLSPFDVKAADKPKPFQFEKEDTLRFLVWNHPELTQIATVQVDGKVTLPLIGEVQAEGKTPEDIRKEVEKKFAQFINSQPVVIQREDTLKLLVWRHEELTCDATVEMDGKVTLPLVGDIQAAGRTIQAVREEVQKKMAKYIADPQVSILPQKLHQETLANPRVSVLPLLTRPRTVAVLGEVNIPGLQDIHGELRLIDALARADTKDSAKLNNVVVIRDPDNKSPHYQVLHVADYLKGKDPGQDIYLQANDIVIVPKKLIARVDLFVQNFFVKTKPVFDWWVAAQQAKYAGSVASSQEKIDRVITRQYGLAGFTTPFTLLQSVQSILP